MIRHGGQGIRVHSSMVKVENTEFISDESAEVDRKGEERNCSEAEVTKETALPVAGPSTKEKNMIEDT